MPTGCVCVSTSANQAMDILCFLTKLSEYPLVPVNRTIVFAVLVFAISLTRTICIDRRSAREDSAGKSRATTENDGERPPGRIDRGCVARSSRRYSWLHNNF
jgi:hypothetical protein